MPPRTFVLVHGAWHGSWCWRSTAAILQSRGHRVVAPTQTGLADRAHLLPLLREKITIDVFIEDITNAIAYEELNDVVLVGHSFGGVVISGVADRIRDKLRKLIYLDALIVDPAPEGTSPLEILSPAIVEQRRALAQASSGGISLPVPTAEQMGIHDTALGKYVEKMVTPHPFATYESKLKLVNPIGNGLPATYVTCVDPIYPPLAPSRMFAQTSAERGWRLAEIATGHDAMVTAPEELADLLEQEAEIL